jgi:hypothetical protein
VVNKRGFVGCAMHLALGTPCLIGVGLETSSP